MLAQRSILKSPRAGSHEVQAKALNDRGDIVGFADGRDGADAAILWKRGKALEGRRSGGLPGYVASEAYAINNHRVVFGLLYDKRERTFPFRWKRGRMTVLRDQTGACDRRTCPYRTRSTNAARSPATLLINGNRRAVRWTRKGKATLLPLCRDTPGQTRGA